MMTECWRYGVLFCNSFVIFGVYYFMEIPVSLQNEIMNRYHFHTGTNITSNQTDCEVCLGLGEVRYNLIFAAYKWTSLVVCLPSGLVIDRLGNSRSVILFSVLPLIGSVMFAVGVTSHAPVTTSAYIMMAAGYSLLAFGDGALRVVQTRVISYCFPEATLISLAICTFGHCGEGVSLYLTPYIATTVGFVHSIWLATVACGLGVILAVVLAFLLHLKTSQVAADNQNKRMMTLRDLWMLPGTYWMFITSVAFFNVCWIVKQNNLPDYLLLRHGYTMIQASQITGIAPFGTFLSPFICLALERIDCDGIMTTSFQSWMLIFYALLGFCPHFNIIVIALADGIGIAMLTVLLWQVLVNLCPTPYIGTLGGLMFSVRNVVTALTFVASGYILERPNTTDVEVQLGAYNNFFLMLIMMSSTGIVCGAVMNVMDTRKTCALNLRIARWRQSNIETIGLISMTEPSSRYTGIDDINENTVNDD